MRGTSEISKPDLTTMQAIPEVRESLQIMGKAQADLEPQTSKMMEAVVQASAS